MTYQPTNTLSLDEPVWFWENNVFSYVRVPELKSDLRKIQLACWDFALRCGNCLNRNWEWRCIQSWLRSWTQVSADDLPCELHDFDSAKWYIK